MATTLNCLVIGENPNVNSFVIKINKTKAVDELKEATKERKPRLKHINFNLWKVNIPLSDEKLKIPSTKFNVSIKDVLGGVEMDLFLEISKYFSEEPQENHIQVIVKGEDQVYFQYYSSVSICISSHDWMDFSQLYSYLNTYFSLKGSLRFHEFVIGNKIVDFNWSKEEFITFVNQHKCSRINPVIILDKKKGTDKQSYIKMLGNLPSPSKIGEPNEWSKHQEYNNNTFCLNHRPPKAHSSIPVSLYCSIFGKFEELCEEDPETEDNLFTYKFCCLMAGFWQNEAVHQDIIYELLSNYLKHPIKLNSNSCTDGTVLHSGHHAFHELNIKIKNELHQSNAYPYLENCGYYLTFCREAKPSTYVTNLPCFLVTLAGPSFSVSGAVFTDVAIVDPLTPAYPLIWLKDNVKMMVALSRTFRALKISFRNLDEYYDQFYTLRQNLQTVQFISFIS